MKCVDCKTDGADCLTDDRVRVCESCLYERTAAERDELLETVAKFRAAGTREFVYRQERDNARSVLREVAATLALYAEGACHTCDTPDACGDKCRLHRATRALEGARAVFGEAPPMPLRAREAARQGKTLKGADAQSLERALTSTAYQLEQARAALEFAYREEGALAEAETAKARALGQVDAAFVKGSEAMRDLALGVARKRADLPSKTPADRAWCRASACIADEIRDLPVPDFEAT